MPRKSKAKNFEIEDVNVSVVKNDDIAVSNNVKTEDTNINNETKEATEHETIDEGSKPLDKEPMEVEQNPKPNKPAKRAAKKTKIQPSQPIQHQSPPEPEPDHQPPPSPPQPIQRQNSVIHNPYLAQRKMAYTREGYEQRTTKYAELFKNAF